MRLVRVRGSKRVHAVVDERTREEMAKNLGALAKAGAVCVSAWHEDPIVPGREPHWGLRRWVSSDQVLGNFDENTYAVRTARRALEEGEQP